MEGLRVTQAEVSDELAHQILETAVEAGHTQGLGYWAVVKHIKRNEAGRVTEMQLRERESPDANSTDKPKTFTVRSHEVSPAVRRMLQDPKETGCQGFIHQMLMESLDGPLAEAIVQVMCYRKVMYG